MSNATLREIAEFLDGSAPLEGVWFGEPHPTERGAFWWRSRLTAALAADDAARGTMSCGHPPSLLLHSAETGEPLYCELCDDKSGRADAERRESELAEANAALRQELAALKASRAAAPQAAPCKSVVYRLATQMGWTPPGAAAPQSVEPVWYRWRYNGEWHSGPTPLLREDQTHVEALYLALPAAPADAEWQEEHMRLVDRHATAAKDYGVAMSERPGSTANERAEFLASREALRAHIATRPQGDGWIACSERMPPPGVKVLVFYRNSYGSRRRTCAHYSPLHTISADNWDDGTPDETEDGAFEPEGWWEEPVESERIEFISDEVTHWRPLPAPPTKKEQP